ncbi:hypothetical protein Tco_0327951 [Tanacetum coccineum]
MEISVSSHDIIAISSKSNFFGSIPTIIATAKRQSEPQLIPSPPHLSEDQHEPQTDPSPRPSPTTHIPDSIPEGSGGNHGGQSSSDRSLLGTGWWPMTLQSKKKIRGKKFLEEQDGCKKEPVSKRGGNLPKLEPKLPTKPDEGTADQNEGNSATQTAPTTTTPTIFGDDETIAQVLIIMSQNKEKLKEKEKGIELKDVEETERPRPTSTKIGSKKKEVKSIADRKKLQGLALSNECKEKHSDLKDKGWNEIKLCIDQDIKGLRLRVSFPTKPQYDETEEIEDVYLNVVIRNTKMRHLTEFDKKILWGDLIIMFNQSGNDEFWNAQQNWKIVSWKLHSSSGIHTIMTDEGIVIHMLVENKYPLKKEVLSQFLKLKLETEEDSTMALELIRFVKRQRQELEPKALMEIEKGSLSVGVSKTTNKWSVVHMLNQLMNWLVHKAKWLVVIGLLNRL